MFEFLLAGPFTLIGTLLGFLVAYLLHSYVPGLTGATYLWVVLVAAGFVAGLVADGRSKRD